MPIRILITGTTGESMPPPYAGIPKVSLLYSRVWQQWGNQVGVTFVYRPAHADDLGAGAQYFFEYGGKPDKFKKLLFLARYFFIDPVLYFRLLKSYLEIYPHFTPEVILYSAYGIFLDKVIFSFRPDVILSEATLIKSFMAAQIAKRRKIPIVFSTYAEVRDLTIGANRYLTDEQRKKYWLAFLDLAELVIGINNCSDGALTYLPKDKVKVFYDTCDFSLCRIKIGESRQQLRDHLKLPSDSFLVGMVGAFDWRKGQDHLIKAIGKIVRAGHSNIEAAICGGSGDPTKWQELVRQEGVSDKIHFFSRLSEMDLTKLYRSLDLYCNLSNTPRSCGLDLALLEAMATGLPIIVYDNGGLPEAIPERQNGIMVATNDIDAVAQAILRIYQLPSAERQSMGAKSSAIAAKSDINSTAEIKLNWLKEVIANYNKS